MRKVLAARLLILAVVISVPLHGSHDVGLEASHPVLQDSRAARVDSLFRNLTWPGQPGCAVSVLDSGKVLLERGYGSARLKASDGNGMLVPMRPETRLRLASVTKPIVSLGILILRDEGMKRDQDLLVENLGSLYPFLRNTPLSSITVKQLLQHTSGLPTDLSADTLPGGSTRGLSDAIVPAYLQHGAGHLLLSPPGTKYLYSNLGYQLLADIIRIKSRMPWTQFMRRRIFEPLKMSDSEVTDARALPPDTFAPGYYRAANGSWRIDALDDWAGLLGSGGMISSARDLAKLSAALDAGRLLTPDSRNLAFTGSKIEASYGLGWVLWPSSIPDPRKADVTYTQSHYGHSFSDNTLLFRAQRQIPPCQLTVAILCNDNAEAVTDSPALAHRIQRIYCPR